MTSAPIEKERRFELIENCSTTQAVLFFLLLYFLVRLPWLMTLPVTEAPDEPNHFWVVHFIAQHWSLPSFEDVRSAGAAAEYGALPPLGYVPHVILAALAPETLMSTFSRFGSLLVGAIVPWIAVLLGKELFPKQRGLALALPFLVVFHPQLVFVNSYTNNDSMATALASAIIYLLVCSINSGITVNKAAVIGVLFGILGLSKHTGLSVAPAVLIGIAMAGYANALTVSQTIARIAAFAATFLAASGWFFVRNYFEFKGDILGTKTMYEAWIKILPTVNGQVQHPWPQAGKLGWWRYVFFDYVGLFGYMDRYLWRPIYIIYLGYTIAAIVGWLKSWKRGPQGGASILPASDFGDAEVLPALDPEGASIQPTSDSPNARKQICIWIIIAAFPLCNLFANLAATIVNVTGPHGRYLFPSELSLLALTIAGLSQFKAGKALVMSLIALNLIVTAGAWLCWYMPVQH